MIYNAEIGLTALDFYTGEELWLLPDFEVSLGGSISYAVDENGNIYVGGYYGPDPVAVDMNGNILWQAQPGVEAYWMYQIEVTPEGIVATYDCVEEHEAKGQIVYGFDGNVKEIVRF